MGKREFGFFILGVGITIFLVSLLADVIRIGGYPAFGTKQIIGVIIGVVIGIIGFILRKK